MEALSEVVTTVDRFQDDVTGLLSTLVLFGFMESGRALQRGLERVLSVVRARVKEVWSPGLELSSNPEAMQVINNSMHAQ